jgi:hypothetical protein
MLKILLSSLILALIFGCSSTVKKHERFYQRELCNNLNGVMEYRLEDKTRVDCITDEYAIEVDFAKKWAESIGQSLFYAKMSGKKPAVGIIINSEKESRYLKRLNLIADKYGIEVFVIER